MYDYLKNRADDLQPEELQSIARSAAFAACDGALDANDCMTVKNFRGQSLRLSFRDRELTIGGTLPTFAHGHNTNLLTYAEEQQAITDLAAAVGLPAERLEVVRVELSADTDLPTSPRPFLESLRHHKASPFCAIKPRAGVARPLEMYATHTDYGVKFYDKGAQAAQHGHYLPAGTHRLRYEVVCTRARAVQAMLDLPRVTLADLVAPVTYAAAAAALLKHWQETVREKPLDFTGLKRSDADLLQSGADPQYYKRLLAANIVSKITVKRYKQRHKQLLAESDKRTANDIYSQRIPQAINGALALVVQVESDTILHTSSKLETALFDGEGNILNPAHPLAPLPAMRARAQPDTRCCKTCGKPITTGNATAKFCSPKERGSAAAKQCRNADSNLRNNKRRALHRIERTPLLFDTRPFVRVPEEVREFVLAAA